jgi:hypothetical protein
MPPYITNPDVFGHRTYPPRTCLCLHMLQLTSLSHLNIKAKDAGTAPVLSTEHIILNNYYLLVVQYVKF